ncbi:MAG: nucleoside triphosphate pyrophosphohydrolase [Gammaproteobacteria bacterium]
MHDIRVLLDIMRTLRDPDSGCPWDVEQTFATIAPYTVEEAYEVVEAIEQNDMAGLKDELGDLLLQVVFHAQMAKEQSLFEFGDVVEAICEKMTRRHPHVFAQHDQEVTKDDVRQTWQEIKQQERGDHTSVLSGVPRALPALKRAQKLGSRASGAGFDWPDITGAVSKVEEELGELKDAIEENDPSHVEEEMGDLLFSLVNVCRHSGIDAEAALGKASAKFIRRFESVESAMNASSSPLELDDLEEAWQQAKRKESGV